ncbi:AraD1 family protein, partial [Rugamonas violacea]
AGAAAGASLLSYADIAAAGRLLPPLDHEDDAHCFVTGTGLTHLGSADTRDAMHKKIGGAVENLSDSMKMFRLGVEGGKPAPGSAGVQPEWFYKGDGSIVAASGQALHMPDFALDGGEEPELAGLYVIGDDGQPYRVGYAIGNEFSDHVTERQNYLYLAHSKLRACGLGPALLVGEAPASVEGVSRIIDAQGEVRWQKVFFSGEQNMSHTIANLEHHHFKYPLFRRAGDVHIHFFGTATLSVADNIVVQAGETFEIEAPQFGPALRNTLAVYATEVAKVKTL